MWKLPLPCNQNCIEELQTALTYKNGTPKYALTAQDIINIQSIYRRYDELRGRAHEDLIAADLLSDLTRDAIHDGYSEVQENARLKKMRSKLMLAADRCPCCGISAVTDLDHHLPRSVYKPIAVYSRNLVPLCHRCNNKKRTIAGNNPESSFIHFYYDNIPTDHRFLIADSVMINGALDVNFKIIKIDVLSDDIYRMLKFQIERVDLNTRLQKEINVFLCSYAISLNLAYGEDKNFEAVKHLLLSNEQHFIEKMGINDWRSSLLSSLSENIEFCDGGFISALGIT